MLNALILGIVEGLTEFLPISSTAHLIIANRLLGLPQNEYWKFFAVFIQSGAILAVMTMYLKQLFNKKLLTNLIVSFLPTAVVGFGLYQIIKGVFFESVGLIAFSLISVGLIFFVVEHLIKNGKHQQNKTLAELNFTQAFFIGLAQALAVIPGVSRAGAVLVVGLLFGFKREQAALYSFLLAVPTILAASVFDMLKTDFNVVSNNVELTLIGFISAYLSGTVVVKWLIKYLQKNDLKLFGLYRIILGILLLLFLI